MALHFLLLSSFFALHVHSAPTVELSSTIAEQQVAFQGAINKPRKLRGRFLQITDMHPDPYYTPKTREETACHRKKAKKGDKPAGWWGTKYSECDSPFRLTNFTLDYLEEHWADEIDFVVWTGDNARHDNDRKLPRTPAEIYDLNRAVAKRMHDIFVKRGVAVIPSLGNNDVWPHNIMTGGPNSITTEFSSIWKDFVPFPSFQVFQRGAYYSVEVVPDHLAVISLNTMYFYDSNKAVGGCEYTDRDDPGNLELDWLEVQLKQFRERNMQVWLSGHVPPSPGNYFSECYVRYVELALRFQDTILGHLYGHMNADHFRFLEADDLQLVIDDTAHKSVDGDLYDSLIEDFEALPSSSKKIDLDDYAVVNTSPPVVPNPFLPTFRIFAYNVTDYGRDVARENGKRNHGHHRGGHGDKDKHCKHSPWRESWKCALHEPWHSDPESPSRMNRLWTPLGYAQYFIPHLEKATKKREPEVKLEYVTFQFADLHGQHIGNKSAESVDTRRPIPLHLLPQSLRNPTNEDGRKRYCAYELDDLTIGSWVKLARRLAKDGKKSDKLRKRFRQYMYLDRAV